MATLRLFQVEADAETGEWLNCTLAEIGKISEVDHHAKVDTDTTHFDTFELEPTNVRFATRENAELGRQETCAINVIWAR